MTQQNPEDGWLESAQIVKSPNFDGRPQSTTTDLLVIHNISLPPGEYGGGYIQQFFSNTLETSAHSYFATIKDMKVSSHFLIDRLGQLTQFVSMYDRAWHAGKSEFDGRSACNDFSLGVELEGTDEMPYTDSQYVALATLTKQLLERFPSITKDRIVGHSDIAPGRKTDPGPSFDWTRYFALVGLR